MKRPLVVALTVIAVAGCTSGGAAPASSGPRPPASSPSEAAPVSVRPSLAPPASASTAETHAASAPPIDVLTPSAVIDVPDSTGVIALTTDGKTVWASTNGAIVRIDTATNATRLLTAPTASGDTTLAIAADGLWATRFEGGKLYRLNPQTGAVQLSVEMPRAVRIAFVGSDLWVGREDVGKMFRVDRKTGAVGASLSQGAYGTAGMGDLWFASDGSPTILRVDPSTGATKATIAAPGESNCGIGGPFPDSAWTGCFGREVEPRSAARIDPASNSLAAVVSLPPSHGVASVVVLDGATWVVASFTTIDDGTPLTGLLRVDPDTGAIERSFSLPGVDADGARRGRRRPLDPRRDGPPYRARGRRRAVRLIGPRSGRS